MWFTVKGAQYGPLMKLQATIKVARMFKKEQQEVKVEIKLKLGCEWQIYQETFADVKHQMWNLPVF